MSKLLEFIQSEPVVAFLAVILTYFGNSLVTVLVNLSRSNKLIFVVARWLHGVTGKVIEAAPVDEKLVKRIALGSLFVAFLVLPGCSIIKSPTFWDAAEKACVLAMTARPEVIAEAQARKLTGNEWAAVICKISDVIEPYVVETDAKKAADKSVERATVKGLAR